MKLTNEFWDMMRTIMQMSPRDKKRLLECATCRNLENCTVENDETDRLDGTCRKYIKGRDLP